MRIEKFQYLAGRPLVQKRLKDQGNARLHFQIGVFLSPALRITFEARRERQRQIAPSCLVEEPGSHTGTNRVQLPFGQRPFQPEKESAVGRGGIIQAIDIRNQAALVAAEVQQGVPIRAVAREPRHIIGQNNADLTEGDLAYQRVEALTVMGTRGALSHIGVHDLNGLWGPAQGLGALSQGILEPEAFLMAQGLMRR